MVYQCVGCDAFTLQPLGYLSAKIRDDKPNQIKVAIPTGPSVDSKCTHCHHKHHVSKTI